MEKQSLIQKAKTLGYKPNTNNQYLFKDLGNGYVVSLQWWGEDINPHIIAVHKDQCILRGSNPYYTDFNYSDHRKLGKINGVKVNKRYLALEHGTTFPLRYALVALELLESKLK